MKARLSRWRVAHKMGLIGVLGLLAIALPAWLTIQAGLGVMNVAQAELGGVPPAHQTILLMRALQAHRIQASALALGQNTGAEAQLADARVAVSKALDATKTSVAEMGDAGLDKQVEDIAARWKSMSDKDWSGVHAQTLLSLHAEAIGQVQGLLEAIVDVSTLALDPDADTFNLIMGTLIVAPQLVESVEQIRLPGELVLSRGRIQPDEYVRLMVSLSHGRERLRGVRSFLDKAIAAEPSLQPVLGPKVEAAVGSSDKLIQALTQALDHLQSPEQDAVMPVAEYKTLLQQAIDQQLALIDSASDVLEQRLATRTAAAQQQLLIMGVSVLALAGLAIALGAMVVRQLLRQLGGEPDDVHAAVGRIAAGEFSLSVATQPGDHSSLLYAVQTMASGLAQGIGEVNAVMAAAASGDFSRQVEAPLRGDLGLLKNSINATVAGLGKTLDNINHVMAQVSEGALSARVDVAVDGDLGKLKDSINQTVTRVAQTMGDVNEVMAEVAQGQLSARVTAPAWGDFDVLKTNINATVTTVGQSMQSISSQTQQVARAASESSAAIGQISDGAQNQMHAISQVATAVRQTATSVEDVTRNTELASQKSRDAVHIVQEGQRKMAQMIAVVNGIAASSEKISKITDVIEDIANRTNLLSLNAAIEAARAGEHGKGFAVVAEEVGKLAISSASSTKEISELVRASVDEVSGAVRMVNEVAEDMAKIQQGSTEAEAMLQRISAALEEQSAAASEIDRNVNSLSQIAQRNAAASEEMAATVIELSKIADQTRQEVARFHV